jgi:hypothetical protein
MVVGGGGGSNSASYYGGAGCCMLRQVYLSADSYTVTIGAGGARGNAGGVTSFGNIAVANGGLSLTNMGLPQNWLYTGTSRPAFCFEYCDYGFDTYTYEHYSTWTYKRCQPYIGGSVLGVRGFNGSAGENSGAGGAINGAGYSGYCIIFWEEELKTKQRNAGDYDNLKIQEFSSSGTWYRPKRIPATMAFIYLKNTSSPYRNSTGTFFLTNDSYTVTTGTSPSFGDILAYGQPASSNPSYGAVLSASTGTCNKHANTPKLGHWILEEYNPSNSFIMWYE